MKQLALRYLSFEDLTTKELHDILQLRTRIFVVEQDCPYLEVDGQDPKSLHILGYFAGQFNAYLRIVFPPVDSETYHIGRVVVGPDLRKKGLGTELIKAALKWTQEHAATPKIRVQAQEHLKPWYETLNFHSISEPYPWDGIPHIDMEWRASSS
jgi:ElaA protein